MQHGGQPNLVYPLSEDSVWRVAKQGGRPYIVYLLSEDSVCGGQRGGKQSKVANLTLCIHFLEIVCGG